MSEDNKRLSILDELDKFNTAPAADSLMLGILQEQEGASRSPVGEEPEPQPEPAPQPEPDDKRDLPDNYLPLNTSIQDLNSRFDSRIAGLERSIQSLVGGLQQQQQRQAPAQPAAPAYDPDMPVTAYHMQELANRQDLAYQMGLKAYKHNLSTRAHLEYQRFKSEHPDFNLDPQQLDYAIDQMARDNKLEQLEGTNWRGHFEHAYEPQRRTQFEAQAKQIDTLTKEIETLKKARSAAPSQPVSPSTGRSSRGPAAISTPLQSSNDDVIVGMKTFRQKGNFKGFANDLKSLANGK